MDIRFEVSNKTAFESAYASALTSIGADGRTVEVVEDSVSYGVVDYVVVGLVFLYQASLSGITWDALKAAITSSLRALIKHRRRQDMIAVYVQDDSGRVEIEIPPGYPNVDLLLPTGLRLKLKK